LLVYFTEKLKKLKYLKVDSWMGNFPPKAWESTYSRERGGLEALTQKFDPV
jgi:hypothetical protein